MNLPNKLTIIRVILIPVFVFIYMTDFLGASGKYVALAVFLIAGFTDFLDGYLARRDNLVTNFGKFMDPLADKLLVCAAMVCFVEKGLLSAYIVIIIMSREFIISGFRLVASDNGVVIAASYWGKFKTVSQMIMCTLLLLDLSFLSLATQIFIWLALALTVISLVDYVYKNLGVLKESK